jgi:hypothetical protein
VEAALLLCIGSSVSSTSSTMREGGRERSIWPRLIRARARQSVQVLEPRQRLLAHQAPLSGARPTAIFKAGRRYEAARAARTHSMAPLLGRAQIPHAGQCRAISRR